jgi:hypothetical protein
MIDHNSMCPRLPDDCEDPVTSPLGNTVTCICPRRSQPASLSPPPPAMVHRPSDSRLLSNLLSSEKDYTKLLTTLLDDTSPAARAALTAYAAASPPPTSTALLAVVASLERADEALGRYVGAVERWREGLKVLREMEEDVGTVMRDREILCVRFSSPL